MRVWNLGNTTLRNPKRIREGLRVLAELFRGEQWSEDGQRRFYLALVDRGLIVPAGGSSPSPSSQAIGGRKWAAAPNQLGLAAAWASIKKGPVVITPAGQALIDADSDRAEQDVYLRQLLKYRLPSPLEKGSKYKGFDVMPFRLMIRILYDLAAAGYQGATKEEIALYIVTAVRNEQAAVAVSNIVNYRALRARESGLVAKRGFFETMLHRRVLELYEEEFKREKTSLIEVIRGHDDPTATVFREALGEAAAGGKGAKTSRVQEFVSYAVTTLTSGLGPQAVVSKYESMRLTIRGETLIDYADSAIRYCRLTGLVSVSGDKLVLSEERQPLTKEIVTEGFVSVTDQDYLEYFRSASQPELPSDRLAFVASHIDRLEDRRLQLLSEGLSGARPVLVRPSAGSPASLIRYARALEDDVLQLREELFSRTQSSAESMTEIAQYFEAIRNRSLLGGVAYLPAFLEWSVWRVFLAVDRLAVAASSTRGFPIDDDVRPTHHARGGVADMVFVYEDFILVCEVTLSTGARQWSMEGEPVPRHVADVVAASSLPVYCLFVAPRIHPQTAEQFRTQTWYVGDRYRPLDIVPMSLNRLEALLDTFRIARFGPTEIREFLDAALSHRTNYNGVDWLLAIEAEYGLWTNAMVGHPRVPNVSA